MAARVLTVAPLSCTSSPDAHTTAVRGLAHAARASFLVGHNTNLMAVYGAFNAAGFGIAVAMCCCFLVIW